MSPTKEHKDFWTLWVSELEKKKGEAERGGEEKERGGREEEEEKEKEGREGREEREQTGSECVCWLSSLGQHHNYCR